ncbi:hypothetical protein [Campylobacter vulpis]|uniref:hypothetical protein n=1 Tax=Campylobacter vulpis TaxID=1655500 RepID=UPI000C15B8AD|nr:hypothetical protein [Campylobacter vulpis]MBS4275596.1 hypothetical protein [Campylobacter vulpis]MBS4306821.1 hypothetical protein [Campylobacter vulpis]MBS4329929.1 hypothetical protein [Campylobacter vulpis]MBS4423576.1 hypothetical protein [Campylobacter vulpis]PHY89919.1 hypothetical protein AA995_07210 [Campylobacter vulpis]
MRYAKTKNAKRELKKKFKMQKTLLRNLSRLSKKTKMSKNAILQEALKRKMQKIASNNVFLNGFLGELR